MKQESFRVLFFLAKKRLMKNGDAPICLRITVNGVFDETRIKRSIPIDLWDQAKERSKGRDRNAIELNEYIRSLNHKLLTIHKELLLEDAPITAKLLMNKLFGREEQVKGKTLLDIFKEHNEKCRQLIGIDFEAITVKRYECCARYLAEHNQKKYGEEDVLLADINGEYIRNFEFFLKTEKGHQQNTVVRYMKCVKKLINLAIANEWMTKNPFAGMRFQQKEVNKEFLTKEELNILMQKEFDIPRIDLVRDVFVFCCFTGLAFIDVQQLKAEHIVKDNNGNLWIRKGRQKTKNMCNIPLMEIPQIILQKYEDSPLRIRKGTLLPVPCNQKMNSYLKEIADQCGIKKSISTHTARHTYATSVCLGNGVSIENVAKMLGHSDTRMTQHYAKVLDSSILEDMKNVSEILKQSGIGNNLK